MTDFEETSPNPSQEPKPANTSEQPKGKGKSPIGYGEGKLDPREMQRRSVISKRRNREALAKGPRETIAEVLHRRWDLLALATERALEDCASEDANLRKSGRAALPRLLDQALGRIETRTSSTERSDPESLPEDRETRMRMIAELEARINDESEG